MASSAPTNKLIKKALSKYRAGDKQAALLLYKKILRADSNHLDANYLLGAVLAELGQYDNALQYTLKADGVSPVSHLIKNNLGNLYRLKGEHQLAISNFHAALAINPHFAPAYNNLGIVYHHQHQLDAAANAYQQAVGIDPGFTDAHFNLGNVLSDLELFDKAAAKYQQVLKLNPNHALAHDRLGSYYIQCDDHAAAIRHLTAYLDLEPNDPLGARLRLAYLDAGESPQAYPTQLVVQTYEKKARNWDSNITRKNMEFLGPMHIQNAVAQFVKSTDATLRILDLGCGTGICGNCLKPYATELFGVDISPAMLDKAKSKGVYDQLICEEVIPYLQGRTHSFDLIAASGVVIFFGNLLPLFSAIAQALSKQGQLIMTTYKGDERDYHPRQNFHFAHSEPYIRHAAEQSGLRVAHLQEIVHEYDFGQAQAGYLVILAAGDL